MCGLEHFLKVFFLYFTLIEQGRGLWAQYKELGEGFDKIAHIYGNLLALGFFPLFASYHTPIFHRLDSLWSAELDGNLLALGLRFISIYLI